MRKEYLVVKEVAEILGCSSKWIYANKESIPGYLRIGTLIRFHKDTLLDRLLTKAKRPPAG